MNTAVPIIKRENVNIKDIGSVSYYGYHLPPRDKRTAWAYHRVCLFFFTGLCTSDSRTTVDMCLAALHDSTIIMGYGEELRCAGEELKKKKKSCFFGRLYYYFSM